MKERFVYDDSWPPVQLEALIKNGLWNFDYPKMEDRVSCSQSPAQDILEQMPYLKLRKGFKLITCPIESGYGITNPTWAVPDTWKGVLMDDDMRRGTLKSVRSLVPHDFLDAFDLCCIPVFYYPKSALDVMEGVDGDGSLESYLAASIFARMIQDIGAGWHGVTWGLYRLLTKSIWDYSEDELDSRIIPNKEDPNMRRLPDDWGPTVERDGDRITVKFIVYTKYSPMGIYEFKDTYRAGSYTFIFSWERLWGANAGVMI